MNSNATNTLQTCPNLLFPIFISYTKLSPGPAHKGCADRPLSAFSSHTNTHAHTKPSVFYLWAEEPWLQPVQTVLSNWATSLYTQGNHPHSSWRNELCIRHPGPELEEKKKKKNIFWKANAAWKESHTRPCCWKNPEFKRRTNPFSSTLVRDSVFAAVCDAVASVPGIFSIKHKSQAVLRWAG